MMRRLTAILVTVAWALAGAAAGHAAAELRRRREAGDTSTPSPEELLPRPQEIVPGLIAAMRVRERPWCYLHIPPWLAAFVVNFTIAAVRSEFRSRQQEEAAPIEGVAMPPPPPVPEPPHVNGDPQALEPEGFTAFAE